MNLIPPHLEKREGRLKNISKFFSMELNSTHLSKQVTSFNLEIGCGHGHWLTSFAQERTDLTFVGIDLITKRIDKANIKKNKRDLTNLHFVKADAIEFISCIPADLKILNCYVMYPDPWPKARHHKRRLINQSFLELLKTKCSNTPSKLFFKTDHIDYYKWASHEIENSSFWKLTSPFWPHQADSFFQDLLPQNNILCAETY